MSNYLRNLPVTSAAFSRLAYDRPTVQDLDPTASPPRKTARIDVPTPVRDIKGKGKAKARDGSENLYAAPKVPVFRVRNHTGELSQPRDNLSD